MPNLSKPKKIKKTKKSNLSLPTKSTKSTHDYYCCCAEKTKNYPKGTKITQLTAHCKNQAGSIAQAKQQLRETEKKKIVEHWTQIGVSLGRIIEA